MSSTDPGSNQNNHDQPQTVVLHDVQEQTREAMNGSLPNNSTSDINIPSSQNLGLPVTTTNRTPSSNPLRGRAELEASLQNPVTPAWDGDTASWAQVNCPPQPIVKDEDAEDSDHNSEASTIRLDNHEPQQRPRQEGTEDGSHGEDDGSDDADAGIDVDAEDARQMTRSGSVAQFVRGVPLYDYNDIDPDAQRMDNNALFDMTTSSSFSPRTVEAQELPANTEIIRGKKAEVFDSDSPQGELFKPAPSRKRGRQRAENVSSTGLDTHTRQESKKGAPLSLDQVAPRIRQPTDLEDHNNLMDPDPWREDQQLEQYGPYKKAQEEHMERMYAEDEGAATEAKEAAKQEDEPDKGEDEEEEYYRDAEKKSKTG